MFAYFVSSYSFLDDVWYSKTQQQNELAYKYILCVFDTRGNCHALYDY